jgi:hypothetical protein
VYLKDAQLYKHKGEKLEKEKKSAKNYLEIFNLRKRLFDIALMEEK